jgi:uncharacterized protein YggE
LLKRQTSNARTKADIAAFELGLKVVGVKSISLNEFETPPLQPLVVGQPPAAAGASAGANTATPICSGQELVL